ncbi:aldehyde dehydrogenase family protein [Capillimicrobium parvum]|uniref:Phenylacetaldehyde dehydrogenase n=1 Tax=Capillimicrobium parvum TaxID=2884022 RepID=A0A9E6XTY3_9ACTN|nr:aldehyde dehydrogenase family protein [Capillimicrobium parvum]UGS34368.1 Phenylacetaldehyde dehydrogenase [Capillimicrobium parvum]
MTTESTERIPLLPDVQRFVDRSHRLLIDGAWVDSASGQTFESVDPSTGERLATVAFAGERDVDRAVDAARRSLSGPWGAIGPADRERILHRLADLMEEHADELAQLESLDNGKPLAFARLVDVDLSISHFRYYAGWPRKIAGQVLPVSVPDMHCHTRLEPVGVCAQIVPWNFPLLMAAWKVAPALAAGCAVILKPAEQTPLTALRLGELALEAGVPAGVLNVLSGDGTTGAALVRHLDVDKIAFTGSTEVGREIGAIAGRNLKRVTLELGGKSPNVILPDADPAAATRGAFEAIYFNSGQSCTAGSRLFVQRDQYDDVVSALADTARATVPGPGLAPDTFLGPVISEGQRARVLEYVNAGTAEGAELVAGGSAVSGPGYFVEPTVFSATSDDLTIAREEIFGPVVVALPYDDLDEVIERANATRYGLAAGIWTTDLRAAHRFADKVRAGSIYINCWQPSDAAAPFGGVKDSGVGREHGYEGLSQYLESKTVWTNLGADNA